jgi:putative ATPase
MSLFEDPSTDSSPASLAGTPLAERMRPATFDEFVGQQDILPRENPARGDRTRSPAIDHPVGAAWHRQDNAGPADCEGTRARFVSFSAVMAGIKEIKDVMAAAETSRRQMNRRDDRLRRRDSPLQQVAAGRVSAARRGRRHRAHRRDHREPVVRSERRAALAIEGVLRG